MKKIEPVDTWRVVNEDPSESYISADDEFMNETVDPLSKSVDPKRNVSCDNAKGKKTSSCERISNIKFSVLSALKRTPRQNMRKLKSTSRVLDDLDRKISSPLLQHAMSAFFNTSGKIQQPQTGPKSIRMSSNASVLYPIREEGGAKMSVDEDILGEVDSSPRSSISSKQGSVNVALRNPKTSKEIGKPISEEPNSRIGKF